jgi:hypothetical protein
MNDIRAGTGTTISHSQSDRKSINYFAYPKELLSGIKIVIPDIENNY